MKAFDGRVVVITGGAHGTGAGRADREAVCDPSRGNRGRHYGGNGAVSGTETHLRSLSAGRFFCATFF